jgi:hypothetical protein
MGPPNTPSGRPTRQSLVDCRFTRRWLCLPPDRASVVDCLIFIDREFLDSDDLFFASGGARILNFSMEQRLVVLGDRAADKLIETTVSINVDY